MYSGFQLTLTKEKVKNCSLHVLQHPEFPGLYMSSLSSLECIPSGKGENKGGG